MAKKQEKKDYKIGKGKPPRGFKPGAEWKGNRLGAGHPNHSPVNKRLKKITSNEVEDVITLILESSLEDLEALAKNKKAPALRSWIATAVVDAVKHKSIGTLERLLDRAIGPIGQKLELSGRDGGPIETAAFTLTSDERMKAIDELRRIRDKCGKD